MRLEGHNALHIAAMYNRVLIAAFLIRQGLDVCYSFFFPPSPSRILSHTRTPHTTHVTHKFGHRSFTGERDGQRAAHSHALGGVRRPLADGRAADAELARPPRHR